MSGNPFGSGAFVVRGDGRLDRVLSLVRAAGEPDRYRLHSDREEWDAASCRLAELHDFGDPTPCSGRHGSATGRRGYVVACSCTRLHAGKSWVKTPCCDAGRRGVECGDTVECPACGWYWGVFIASGGTRWWSMGCGKDRCRSFTKTASGRAIGITQYRVLAEMAKGSGQWSPGCGWYEGKSPAVTVRALEGLVRRALVKELKTSRGGPCWEITEAGRGEVLARRTT